MASLPQLAPRRPTERASTSFRANYSKRPAPPSRGRPAQPPTYVDHGLDGVRKQVASELQRLERETAGMDPDDLAVLQLYQESFSRLILRQQMAILLIKMEQYHLAIMVWVLCFYHQAYHISIVLHLGFHLIRV